MLKNFWIAYLLMKLKSAFKEFCKSASRHAIIIAENWIGDQFPIRSWSGDHFWSDQRSSFALNSRSLFDLIAEHFLGDLDRNSRSLYKAKLMAKITPTYIFFCKSNILFILFVYLLTQLETYFYKKKIKSKIFFCTTSQFFEIHNFEGYKVMEWSLITLLQCCRSWSWSYFWSLFDQVIGIWSPITKKVIVIYYITIH